MASSTSNKIIHLSKSSTSDRKRVPGLKITSMKTIKQPDAALVKKQEVDNLRAELHKEIKWRSRACAHLGYECTLPVVCGREYCARHILEDPTAPYKQCLHTYSNGERCPLPAPAPQNTVHDNRKDQGLCFEHARAAMSARQRSGAPPPPVTTVETLLYQLQHYVRPERARTTSCASTVSVVSDPDDGPAPHPLDPFKQIDAVAVNASSSVSLMEFASGSDSDADSVTLGRGGSCRGGADEDLSGDEEAPYDRHPLRYAGVFTAEEAVWSARAALRQLQAGYVRQLGRLTHLLRIERAKYLKQLKVEREHYCSINTQARSGGLTAKERKQLRKLKAYASYRTRRGVCAVLARKLHRKRARAADPAERANSSRIAAMGRCSFAEGGVRCEARSLPAARHCLRHIIHDRQQVLFAMCGDRRAGGGGACREPVARLPLPSRLCRYHTDPPHYAAIALKKGGESDSETTESGSERDSESEYQQQSDWQST